MLLLEFGLSFHFVCTKLRRPIQTDQISSNNVGQNMLKLHCVECGSVQTVNERNTTKHFSRIRILTLFSSNTSCERRPKSFMNLFQQYSLPITPPSQESISPVNLLREVAVLVKITCDQAFVLALRKKKERERNEKASQLHALLLNSQSDLHPKFGCRTCGLRRFVSGLRFIFSLFSCLYFFRAPPRRPDRRLLSKTPHKQALLLVFKYQ